MGYEVVDTPFGKFQVNPAEGIGSTVKAGTVWDGPGFLQVIAREHGRLGEAGTSILDIGAHLGDWTVWLAGQGAWRVVAVEPAPPMIQMLKANLDLNKAVCAETVVVIPVAGYDKRALLDWTRPYHLDHSGGAALQPALDGLIPALPLDEFQLLFGQEVSLIKVDAQGCDAAVLVGLQQTIERDHPVIVFEWEEELSRPHGYTLAGIITWLMNRGYAVLEWPSHLLNYIAIPGVR